MGNNTNAYSPECIFQQQWWWDAVCPRQNQREFSLEDGSLWKLAVIQRMKIFPMLAMPVLTQHSGPYLTQRERFIDLFQQLPAQFSLNFNLGFELTIREIEYLNKAGVSVRPGVSHRIEDCSDLEQVWTQIKDPRRRQIKKARKLLHKTECPVEKLIELQKETFRRRNMQLPYPENIVRQLCQTVSARNAGKLLGLADEKGEIMAAGLFVYDKESCYSLTHGFKQKAHDMGAGSLLQWEGIEIAAEKKLIFDFEGSNIESIANFNLSFGSTPKKYHRIERNHIFLKAAMELRQKLHL